jgi:ribosomal silencing factor RsfS
LSENSKLQETTSNSRQWAICEVLYNKKAVDIVAIHVADKTIVADGSSFAAVARCSR